MMNVNERIGELLAEKGWTGYELSKQTGLSTNTIYEWTKGRSVPSLSNIVKICEAFGITLRQFFFGTDSYELSEDEKEFLREWFTLSDLERSAVKNMIETFRILRRGN